jgi:hypothetical protein
MQPNLTDPVIDEVRQVRHRISERCGHEPDRLVAYYLELQQQYRARLLGQAEQPARPEQSAAQATEADRGRLVGGSRIIIQAEPKEERQW